MAADPALLQTIAFLGGSALICGIVLFAALGLWRAMTDERPLLLSELLALEGVDMAPRIRGVGAAQFGTAARKCMACAARARCEEWLGGRRDSPYQAFCPNAGYVQRMKQAGS